MRVQKVLQSFLVVSLLLSGIAQAQENRPPRYPGPSHGDNRPPGPVRPNPGDECRYDRRNPRCNDGRDDGRWDDHRGGGYYPPPRPRPQPRPPYNPPYQPPYNPPPVYNPPPSTHNESSIVLPAVTRRGGGEWLRVSVNYPIRIDYISVRVYSAAVQLHEAYVTTRSGARYQLRELSYTGTFSSQRVSEILNIYEDIVAIDIRAESMGGYADLGLTVVSSDGSTSLSLSRF